MGQPSPACVLLREELAHGAVWQWTKWLCEALLTEAGCGVGLQADARGSLSRTPPTSALSRLSRTLGLVAYLALLCPSWKTQLALLWMWPVLGPVVGPVSMCELIPQNSPHLPFYRWGYQGAQRLNTLVEGTQSGREKPNLNMSSLV